MISLLFESCCGALAKFLVWKTVDLKVAYRVKLQVNINYVISGFCTLYLFSLVCPLAAFLPSHVFNFF